MGFEPHDGFGFHGRGGHHFRPRRTVVAQLPVLVFAGDVVAPVVTQIPQQQRNIHVLIRGVRRTRRVCLVGRNRLFNDRRSVNGSGESGNTVVQQQIPFLVRELFFRRSGHDAVQGVAERRGGVV